MLRSVAPQKTADQAEIQRTFELLFEPGTVFEVRCPKKKGAGGVVSGYFDDIGAAVKAAADWSGRVEAVYVTLNPTLRDLLARACNRAVPYAGFTSADRDVIRRRWMLVDFDPMRPAGISSTDAEHAAALARALDCREWLRAQGFTEPIYASSGNGAHLLYRLDGPNDAAHEQLVKDVLHVLAARFDDEAVKVDLACFNAARVSKVYGTLAAKGDNVPELGRVWRLALILEVPPVLLPLTLGGAV